MLAWILGIAASVISAGAVSLAAYMWKQAANYKKLLKKEEHEAMDEHIEAKIQPIIDDMEGLRDYVRQVDKDEQHKINLIVQSYRYRLSQLCRIYLRQGYITFEQYDQLNEFYHLYVGLGGNGEAKALYERVIALDLITDEQARERKKATK